ncbi:MAG: hypothetical protein WA477_15570 [Candidatus Sulfotelmatobacter sp.]
MKLAGVISAAVLSLTLGVAAPAFAQQEQHDQQEEQKAKPAQDEKKAQPEKSAKAEEKNAKQEEKSNKPQERNAQQEKNTKEEKNAQEQHTQQARPKQQGQFASKNGGGRIPADRYKAHFGQEHRFRVNEGDYRNRRFQYGGYWFGFVGAWPSNWLYTQDVYVVEIDGMYYLCNPMYPGVNLEISVNL